jgi:hypothetical protein
MASQTRSPIPDAAASLTAEARKLVRAAAVRTDRIARAQAQIVVWRRERRAFNLLATEAEGRGTGHKNAVWNKVADGSGVARTVIGRELAQARLERRNGDTPK